MGVDMRQRLLSKWAKAKTGQFSLFTAILGIPLVIAAGLASDHTQVSSHKADIKGALDAAVLAAVLPANLSDSQRNQFVKEAFVENYTGTLEFDLFPTSSRDQVHMKVAAKVPTRFGGIVGINYMGLKEESEAVLTTANVVCVLALDTSVERAIEFKDNATFNAPSCSVQANSNHRQAIYSQSPYQIAARQFCSNGSSYGTYDGIVKHGCSPISDPYETLAIPAQSNSSCLKDTVKTNSTLNPGVYCDGLKIDGAGVKFNPGVYHIWGELLFTSTSVAVGNDVTFILKGSDGSLKIDNDADVKLKAPMTGATKGLVFWQVPTDSSGKKLPYPVDPTGKSEISASGGLSIIGTAYFPTHELTITSDKKVATQSPATSFIAQRLQFAGNSSTTVNVDHEKGGVPPLLPRSDEGARLVR